jgi:hypothetical protein
MVSRELLLTKPIPPEKHHIMYSIERVEQTQILLSKL